MLETNRKPASVGEIMKLEFMEPLNLTQQALAAALGVKDSFVEEICNGERAVCVETAYLLGRAFENSPEFWLNTQVRCDMWDFQNSDDFEAILARVTPFQ